MAKRNQLTAVLRMLRMPSRFGIARSQEADRRGALMRIGVTILAGIAIFFAIDRAVFGTNLYFRWIAPTSGLGVVAQALDRIAHAPADRTSLLIIGDSRIGEGFSADVATREARKLGSALSFTNAAVAGSMPRVWYYMLRRAFGDGHRPGGVAIMLPSYHDNDPEDDPEPADRRRDIVFVHPLLSVSDIVDFPQSFTSLAARTDAVEAVAFKGLFYKNDLQNFLQDPAGRVSDVQAWREHGREWIGGYQGRNESLAGLKFDPETGQLAGMPAHGPASPDLLAQYAQRLRQDGGRPPDNPAATSYRAEWLGRIADLCRQAGVKLYVFRVPRGPLHAMSGADEQPTGVVAGLAESGRIILVPAATFDGLERPEFFFDELHMNRAGREVFSVEIAKALQQAG